MNIRKNKTQKKFFIDLLIYFRTVIKWYNFIFFTIVFSTAILSFAATANCNSVTLNSTLDVRSQQTELKSKIDQHSTLTIQTKGNYLNEATDESVETTRNPSFSFVPSYEYSFESFIAQYIGYIRNCLIQHRQLSFILIFYYFW